MVSSFPMIHFHNYEYIISDRVPRVVWSLNASVLVESNWFTQFVKDLFVKLKNKYEKKFKTWTMISNRNAWHGNGLYMKIMHVRLEKPVEFVWYPWGLLVSIKAKLRGIWANQGGFQSFNHRGLFKSTEAHYILYIL